MVRKSIRLPVLVAGVLAVLAGALAVPTALLRPLAGPPAVPAMAGCETDPAALGAIDAAVNAALAKHPLAPGDANQLWRLHSICKQGDWAYAYLKPYARTTLAPLPSVSEVVLAQATPAGWVVLLPDMGAAYNQALNGLPDTLLPAPAKALLVQPSVAALAARARFSNYALPFPAGQSAYVIWHWYLALDFSIGSANGSTGTVRNAKAGVAVFVKDSSTRECGDPPPDWYCWMAANTVVIQSAPDEYAWYLHLAPNSVPDWIVEGAYVPAGADLGQEGATGWAASPHLHFQVANWYACCDGEGDSRMPLWPFNNLQRVDFAEYAWESLPWQATSQNGPPAEPAQPPAPTAAPPVVEPPAQAPPAEPTAAPPVASAPTACASPYTVQRGDWLLKIADRCGVTLAAIVAANPGIRPQLIYAGQALIIPGGAAVSAAPAAPAPTPTAAPVVAAPPAATGTCTGTHVVARGENLFRIAYNCGLTTAQLAAANGIGYPYTIYSGQALRFP